MPVRLLEMNKVGKSENSSCNPVSALYHDYIGPELGSEKSATLGRKPVSLRLTLRTLVAAVGLELISVLQTRKLLIL
jgi:hypothetical protein